MATDNTNSRRGKRIGILTTILLLVGGGLAFAYWTNSGSGTGSAATGDNDPITIVQTSTVSAMGPGVAPQALSGTFNNPNPGPVYVASVSVSIDSISGGGPTCDADDYTITGSPMTINAQVSADDTTPWSGASIAFNNKANENQDDCKNATVNLAYTSN
jgi:hypothetical protein